MYVCKQPLNHNVKHTSYCELWIKMFEPPPPQKNIAVDQDNLLSFSISMICLKLRSD